MLSKVINFYFAGIYCGPLRLLAWEIAKRLNKAKVPCDLITGQEREEVDGANHKAVTVEMADVSVDYKCAVIDEIQASQIFILRFLFRIISKITPRNILVLYKPSI